MEIFGIPDPDQHNNRCGSATLMPGISDMVPVLVLLIRIQGSSGSGFGIRNPDPDPVVLNREKYQIFTTFYFFTEFLMTFTMFYLSIDFF